MRLVDINDIKSKVHYYDKVPQPMSIYHSTEEFEQNEKDYILVSSFDELLAFFRKNNIDLNYFGVPIDARNRDIQEYNLWVKTVDKFIPDYADIAGAIFYVTQEGIGFLPTDACYVKVYYIVPLPSKIVLYTSAGVNSVSITKWEVTAAVRSQFLFEKDLRKATSNEEVYQMRVKNLLNRTRPNVDMYKFMFAFLNEKAPSFLDLDKSAVLTFGAKIKKPDRYKILQSPMFVRAMTQVIKILMPELSKEARDQFPPKEMISLLADAAKIAKETKKVSDILEVFDKLQVIGYEENTVVQDSRLPNVPLVGQNKPAAIEQTIPPQNVEKEPEETDDAMFERLRDEVDSIGAFVTIDLDEEDAKTAE